MTNVYANLMTPRSGSTLIQLLVYYYLKHKYGNCTNLKNYFNIYHYNMYFEKIFNNNIYIGKKNHTTYTPDKKLYREEIIMSNGCAEMIYNYNINGAELKRDIHEETHHRLMCIKNTDPRHILCFKLHAFPDLKVVYDYALYNNWFIICTERDPLEQLFEYFISLDSQIWAFFEISAKNIKKILPKRGSLVLKKEPVIKFLERLRFYHEVKNSFSNKIIVKYEDLKNISTVWDCYSLIGFNDWEKYINIKEVIKELPVKIPFDELENYFINADESKKWYEEWKEKNPIL